MDLEKRVIQSNQDVHVCGPIYVEWIYMVEVVWKHSGTSEKGKNMVKTSWKHNSTLSPWKHTSLLEIGNTC
jgi:hypothetical protein